MIRSSLSSPTAPWGNQTWWICLRRIWLPRTPGFSTFCTIVTGWLSLPKMVMQVWLWRVSRTENDRSGRAIVCFKLPMDAFSIKPNHQILHRMAPYNAQDRIRSKRFPWRSTPLDRGFVHNDWVFSTCGGPVGLYVLSVESCFHRVS